MDGLRKTLSGKIDISLAIKELAEAARHRAGPKPTPEELIAYADGVLSAEQQEQLQTRLALDPQATQAVLDLRDPSRLRTEEAGRDEAAADAHVPTWEQMNSRLLREAHRLPLATPAAGTPRRGVHPLYRLALAACVPIVAGLGLWVAMLSGVSEDIGPRVNVYSTDLLPWDDSRPRDSGAGQAVKVAAESSHFMLVMNIGDSGVFPIYRVDVLDRDGVRIWGREGFKPSPIGTFNLELPRNFLPAGLYVLRLAGVDGDRTTPLANYPIRLIYE